MQSEPLVKEKSWDKSFEPPLYQKWKEDKLYSFDRGARKPLFSIDTPPPYVNTPVHIGQVTTYVLMDMFARFHRMTGHKVIFPLGLDRNGLPIEMAAEKKFNVRLNEVEREKFIEMCRTVLEESSATSTDSFLRCGIAFSSWKFGPNVGEAYMTDSPEYRSLTQATFIDMWNAGLIYESERTNNYCPGCRTTLADAEVDYIDVPTKFYDLAFKVKETGEEIIIATTRPELLGSCAVVIYNPADKRYAKLKGKHAIVPLFNKEVPIKDHPIADPEKGSGLVMMCSFGDLSDIRFFREMNLAPVYSIGADGRLNGNAGPAAGLNVKKGRAKIVEELQKAGLIRAAKDILHRTPICERSKDPIEFIAMKEFYAKQLDQRERMLKMADDLNFFAPESRKILIDWINSLAIDWPISRRRYYATEVPLWYCGKGHACVPPKGKYYRPWKERPPFDSCPQCGDRTFTGETRVLDTWFDSSITALYVLGYGRDDEFFKAHPQCTVRPQGKEIIRTWLYYTLLKCYLLTKKQIFRDAWINYHIVDGKGEKMSKSVGNVIDPQKVLDQFGAEPFRLWAATEGNLTQQDFRCANERIQGAGKSLNKLWNVAKYVSMFEKPKARPKILSPLDQWILNEVYGIARESKVSFENYDFHNPSIRLRHFLWDTFASHYVELSKNRAYNSAGNFTAEEQQSALWTLHECLNIFLKVMAPITPFITSKLYEGIYGADVHAEAFPVPTESFEMPFATADLEEMNSAIWKAKKDKGLSLKDEVIMATVHGKFKSIQHDLIHAHTIRKLDFGEFGLELPAAPAPKASPPKQPPGSQ